jgi:NAD(P)-dependent dehydrogenase (short-subunit alcohol dehydrogenase family)
MTHRAALITGGARRIGAAIVESLAEAGYSVCIHCRNLTDDSKQFVERLRRRDFKVEIVVGNLSDHNVLERMIDEAVRTIGPLSLLVNSASVFDTDTLESFNLESWQRNFDVNLRAPVFLTRKFSAQAEGIDDPSVINLVDHRVLKLTPQHFSYTLSKSALYTATITMAQALAPNVRVNAIGPGPTLPNHHEGEAGLIREVAGIPLARRVSTNDIADAVLYLARARAVSGQLIAVDAGQHIGWKTPDIVSP